jgi:lipopolysaccharide export system permease protein
MVKTFEKYLVKLFLKKLLTISAVFFSLIIITSIFDEISFFKNSDLGFFFPVFITLLNTPSILFQVFPFIFLITAQFFFLDLINKDELSVLKTNGLSNLKIIRILFFTSFLVSLFLITFYYSFSSKLKFLYLDLKNSHSQDDKYLAVVTENGLWVKDEIDNKVYIVSASQIKESRLLNVLISEFDTNFDLVRVIHSSNIDITDYDWVIIKPTITKNNESVKLDNNIKITTHFNSTKIKSLFRNMSSLSIFELIKLNNDYKSLGYSTTEVKSYLHKIISLPWYLPTMTLLGGIIMLNIGRNKSMIFHIVLGIFFSVLVYYFYYLFNLLGENERIPILISIWMPLLLLTIFILIGLVRINEK